jgi:CheY-like chemotaxis protein
MPTRILVIDDDNMTLQFVGTLLRSAGYEVQVAADGPAGLALATSAPPDIVLLDVVMPAMDGYEVCRRLQNGPKTQNVLVIMLTASGDPTLNHQAYAAGAYACVPKPFRREALIATIESVRAGATRQKPDNPSKDGGKV